MAAKCPLGFGAGKAASSPMECKKCKTLAFEAVSALLCRCIYCNECLTENIKDCYGCAADIEGSEPAQHLVDTFVKAHAPRDDPRGLGMFWLTNAVKHERNSHMFAADAFYNRALEAFRKDPELTEEVGICMSKVAEIRWKSMQDLESARELFKAAVEVLSQKDSLKSKSLGVTCMKWAAFEHSVGNREKSLELFDSALSTRVAARKEGLCSDEDVAACYFGKAGTLDDLGRRDEAKSLYKEVLKLVPDENEKSDRVKAMRKNALECLEKPIPADTEV